MNFYDLYTRVEDEIQDTQKTTVVKDFINRIYIELCNEVDRRLLIKIDDFSLATATEDYDLPNDCAEIIAFYKADLHGASIEPQEYFDRTILDDAVTDSDDFFRFMVMNFENPDLLSLNSTNGITIVSDNAADTMEVTLVGADKILDRFSETVTLTGTSTVAVHLTNGITKIKEITIDGITKGTLSLTNADTSAQVTTIATGITFVDYGKYRRQVKITEIPSSATTIKIAYYRKAARLTHDFEYPVLPEYMHDIIVSGVLMKYYKYVNNIQLSGFWQQEYEYGKQKATDRETQLHTARNLQMVML